MIEGYKFNFYEILKVAPILNAFRTDYYKEALPIIDNVPIKLCEKCN